MVFPFNTDELLHFLSMTAPKWLQPHLEKPLTWLQETAANMDWDYLEYLFWLFLPIFIVFVLPVLLLFFIYGCAIFLHIYALRHQIREAYASSIWDGARMSIASFWDGVGWIWHGYEVDGLENIPDKGPALFVAFHGTLPLDIYYLIARVILLKKRQMHVVGDKFVFKIPGWNRICNVFCVTPGTVSDCVACLKAGNLQIIAPGGVREALFSNPVTYKIMWAKRLGFAKVAQEANVPIIPVFTENCREAFRTPRWGRKLCRAFYERTRLPLCPIYGGFPVKMITHLGRPLTFDDSHSAEDIKTLVRQRIDEMIQTYQRLPGSVIAATWQRFRPDGSAESSEPSTQRSAATHTTDTAPDTEGLCIPSDVDDQRKTTIPDDIDEESFVVQEKEDADLSEFS